jgi:uncharacterized protein
MAKKSDTLPFSTENIKANVLKAKLPELIEWVEANSANVGSLWHGREHWQRVARIGTILCLATPGSDLLVTFGFALFHDSQRHNEDEDPEHGPRAAAFFRATYRSFGLSDVFTCDQARLIEIACRNHTTAEPTSDPILGVCYDADRLDLWRVCLKPDSAYLSTREGKRLSDTEGTRYLSNYSQTWDDVIALFIPYCG